MGKKIGRPVAQEVPRYISPEDLAWLAGLMEGEACFEVSINRNTSPVTGLTTCYRSPKIRVSMTDQDVVQRILGLVGHGTIRRNDYFERKKGHQVQWVWRLGPVASIHLMIRLWPYMGRRRRARMAEILSEFSLENPTTRAILPSIVEEVS